MEVPVVGGDDPDADLVLGGRTEFLGRAADDVVERLPPEAQHVQRVELRVFETVARGQPQPAPHGLNRALVRAHRPQRSDYVHVGHVPSLGQLEDVDDDSNRSVRGLLDREELLDFVLGLALPGVGDEDLRLRQTALLDQPARRRIGMGGVFCRHEHDGLDVRQRLRPGVVGDRRFLALQPVEREVEDQMVPILLADPVPLRPLADDQPDVLGVQLLEQGLAQWVLVQDVDLFALARGRGHAEGHLRLGRPQRPRPGARFLIGFDVEVMGLVDQRHQVLPRLEVLLDAGSAEFVDALDQTIVPGEALGRKDEELERVVAGVGRGERVDVAAVPDPDRTDQAAVDEQVLIARRL